MKYSNTNKPIECMMKNSTCYKETQPMLVKGILWHSTGANNPNIKRYVQPDDTASNKAALLSLIGTNSNRNDWNHIYIEAGLNAWVGLLANGSIGSVQTLPWNYRPWGCGSGSNGSCNDGWIQFEICEDDLSDINYFNAVYKEAVELTAYLCQMFNINPNGKVSHNGVTVPTILCHQDSYKLGLGSNHSDVYHWFTKFGKSMESVRRDVAALLNPPVSQPAATPSIPFRPGDIVKISGTTYFSGVSVPTWVRNKNWVVYSVIGERVVINKSEDGSNSIMSPFKASSLTLVKRPETVIVNNNFAVGGIVNFTGILHYPSAHAAYGYATKASMAKITAVLAGAEHPFHVRAIDKNGAFVSGVYGWVNAADIGAPVAKPAAPVVIDDNDIVKITGTRYYDGSLIPSWVRNKNWIVYDAPAGSDRIIINESVDGLDEIMSPIKRSDLTLVKKA